EYVVALNDAATDKTVSVPTYMANTNFQGIYPAGSAAVTSDANRGLAITVPALGAVVYRAGTPLAESASAPGMAFVTPTQDATIKGRQELRAQLDRDLFAEVTFWAKRNDADPWTHVGTDDNPPYRVLYDTAGLPAGTHVRFKATVRDHSGNERSVETAGVVGN
ncbi:MAG TPA: hypothetical protein VNO21_19305, partial [Polyangiaceae bacterium]|nr:hypothetical protein [Polyangiaceae bacterium]